MELSGEEGRGKLRKASVRSKHPLTRGYPNGVTHVPFNGTYRVCESIAARSETWGTEPSKYPEEKKSNLRDSLSSGERTGKSPNQYCYGDIGVVGRKI